MTDNKVHEDERLSQRRHEPTEFYVLYLDNNVEVTWDLQHVNDLFTQGYTLFGCTTDEQEANEMLWKTPPAVAWDRKMRNG